MVCKRQNERRAGDGCTDDSGWRRGSPRSVLHEESWRCPGKLALGHGLIEAGRPSGHRSWPATGDRPGAVIYLGPHTPVGKLPAAKGVVVLSIDSRNRTN